MTIAYRGRASVAALAVASPVKAEQRLAPPLHLSEAARSVWLEVVNDQPASAFTATHSPMLEMYCGHVVQARVIEQQIEAFDAAWMADDEGLKRYDRLLAMREREGRAASSLATRLRLTRQAVEHPTTVGRTNARQAKARKPWQPPE